MGRDTSSSSFLLRWAAALLLGCGVAQAMAQADPPGRVARLNYSEGKATYAPAGDDEWSDADPNRPLVRGDKLWTDKGVRTEIQVGSSVVRMDGRTQLTVLALDDQSAQWSVTQGTVYVRVRNLPEGENFEIDTPNLAYRAAYPGDYRIDVDGQRGITRVTIHSGTGAVYGEKGETLTLGGGQQISFKGRALEKVNVQEQPPQDNFDRWAAERNRREDQSVAARYVPRDVVGYQSLDASGEWRNDTTYGPVWYPQGVAANWAPYRNGRWDWIDPWGWTWIDDAPWAFVTSHYGRWTMMGTRWAWAPGRPGLHPIYAPALVAFVGNGNSPLAVGGKQSVAWFPLAPGEAWQPPYKATPLYISSVNANMPPLKEGAYAYQRKPEALTAIPLDDFNRGKPARGSWLRVAANALGNAQVVAPPAMPEHSRTTFARTRVTSPDIKQVTTSGPTVQQQIEAQRQAQREAEAQKQRAAQLEQQRLQQEQQARTEQSKREEQQKLAEQRRVAEQLKQAETARRAEQQRTADEQRRIAEQTRRIEQQKQAEQQRIAQRAAEQARAEARAQARAEAARVAQAQRAVEQKRAAAEAKRAAVEAKREREREAVAAIRRAKQEQRELQARRTQEARRLAAAAAKKDEQARRAAHAQQVEQARRAADRDAQVLAQQRAERERKLAEDKERAQRDAWQKQQQALAEQFKRDQQAWEEQQRAKAQRQRPDLRRTTPGEPEVWQRGIPVLSPGRTS